MLACVQMIDVIPRPGPQADAIAEAKAVGRDPDDIRKAVLSVGVFVLFANPEPAEVFSTGRWWVAQVERIGQVEPAKPAKSVRASGRLQPLFADVSQCLMLEFL